MQRSGVRRCIPLYLLLVLILPAAATAQKFYTYVGQIEAHSVLLAWGTLGGPGNTIGLESTSYGRAIVKVGGATSQTQQNWAIVNGLNPDTTYFWTVTVNDKQIGSGEVRTYPERSSKLAFFVIGDYGNGTRRQYDVASAMAREFDKHNASDSPVRFVLTVGDNVYADTNFMKAVHSGDLDWHWESKFFRPYERVLGHIPFYPTLGNHDGNASENRGDLAVYLDNFFFPGARPARWYRFSFGGLADFFALDSSENTEQGPAAPAYAENGEQLQWLRKALPAASSLWKIPYFHHPPFNAGPRHSSYLEELRPMVDLFSQQGVRVIFTGHEHNFQFSRRNDATGGILYVVSGAGGELRPGNITRHMERANIEGWMPQTHFLLVEIQDRTMRITPVSSEPVTVRNRNGSRIEVPIQIALP